MRTDFENIPDRSRVRLFPRPNNPLHKKPVEAIYVSGYYVCDGTSFEAGPDYYVRDVAVYNQGFELIND